MILLFNYVVYIIQILYFCGITQLPSAIKELNECCVYHSNFVLLRYNTTIAKDKEKALALCISFKFCTFAV